MSYTPGPWKVFDEEFYAVIRQEGVKNGIEIAHVGKREDAELIATAPDMKQEIDQLKAEKADLLEALEEIASVIDESEGVAGWHLNGAVAPWSEFGFAQKIEDVIQKARGEE